MKTIHCQNIINGERCGDPVTKIRGKFCNPCGKERNRLANIACYYRNKTGWKPYHKKCACGVDFLIETRKQVRRIDCNDCKKGRKYPSKNTNKSTSQRVKCKCPSCEEIHHKTVSLHPDELKRVNSGRPYRKRCEPCRKEVSNYSFCPDADGHGARVM